MEKLGAASRREDGQMLILFVMALTILLGFTAMTIDVGMILHERRELQKSADAAALAGAAELPDDAYMAMSKSREWAVNNGIDAAAGDEFEVSVAADRTSVSVRVGRQASFLFGRVLGLETVDVHASATAAVGAPARLASLMPFGVLESAIDYDGNPTTIKYDANNLSNGNFGPIRIDGPGGAIHQESIMNGSETSVCGLSQPSCTDATVSTQTGNLIGPTSAGFEYVFANTSSDCDEFDEVLIPTDGDAYRIRGTCNPWSEDTSSLRLVLVPVIDSFCNGSCDVTILYFTAMFLNELGSCTGNECEVTGTFVSMIADPTSGAELGIYDEDSPIKFVRLVK